MRKDEGERKERGYIPSLPANVMMGGSFLFGRDACLLVSTNKQTMDIQHNE